jgi:L-alanine-DL-glutamate epimerase-like enolase superfamily enzyme
MRISALRCAVVHRAYDGSVRNTRHAWHGKNYVLVQVESDDGGRGLGEMYCDGGGSPEVALAVLRDEVGPHLLGLDARRPAAVTAALREHYALSARGGVASMAISAVDMALWDMVGRRLGCPVYQLLGGREADVPVYASGGMYGAGRTPSALAEEMHEAQRSGLRGAKIKVGAAAWADEDVERVARVREAIGPEAPLMVDAMFAPTLPQAVALARALAPFGLHFLEAPTDSRDVQGWAEIHRLTGVDLAGPELSDDVQLMRALLETRAISYLQFDVTIAGGLSQGRDLAALARAHWRDITLHCAASAVATAASAHLAAAVGHCDGLEFHVMHDGLRDRLWACDWKLREGRLVIPDRPGLGIDLGDEERHLLEMDTCCVD